MQFTETEALLLFAVFAALALAACWLLVVSVYRADFDQRRELFSRGYSVVALVAVGALALALTLQGVDSTSENVFSDSGPPDNETEELTEPRTGHEPARDGNTNGGNSEPEHEPLDSDTSTAQLDLQPLVAAVNELSDKVSSPTVKLSPESVDLQPITRALAGIEARLIDAQRVRETSGGLLDFLPLMIFLAVLLGVAWYLWHRDRDDPQYKKWKNIAAYVVLALSVLGSLFTAAKPLFEAWAAYVEIGEQTQLVALIAVPSAPEAVSDVAPSVEAPIAPLDIDDRLTTLVIPFDQEGSCEDLDSVGGVRPSQQMVEFLTWFGSHLKACRKDDGENVVLRVRGFASSSEVSASMLGACDVSSSDAANLKFAEARASGVQKILEEACGSACIVKVVSWHDDYDAMEVVRGFNDRVLQESGLLKYSMRRGMLNRRVEITIDHAADCTMLPVRSVVGS